MDNLLRELIIQRSPVQKKGICSVCSANEFVLEAVMELGIESGSPVLIEATSNQVNQFGGYTGMKPEDFMKYVHKIALEVDFPIERLILGGDHLGPQSWQHENECTAMEKAQELVRQYVLAGFTKIHIDTSMRLGDDNPNEKLSTAIIAKRSALLAETAEIAYQQRKIMFPDAIMPMYVIGSEVPIPGGVQGTEETVAVTSVKDFEEMMRIFADAYHNQGQDEAYQRIIAVVVQPGVEFSDDTVMEYDRQKAKELTNSLNKYSNLVFEGHSTDYQTSSKLSEMVQDGIAILKVGPALTFALREALFSLELIEKEILSGTDITPSDFMQTIENAMVRNDGYWKKYYHGTPMDKRLKRKYSFSDRCRYYLNENDVTQAIEKLIRNIDIIGIPLSLLDQYMPIQYRKVRQGILQPDGKSLIKDRIKDYLSDYLFATGWKR